jgi:sterol desaturase/sphingolipid hydroxylase (fatty acid hydroxylase superfamily)
MATIEPGLLMSLLAPAAIVTALAVLALLEVRWPDRAAARQRWPLNFAIGLTNAALVRLTGTAAPLAVSLWAAAQGFGLFNQLAVPLGLAIIFGIIAMDFAIYWQHRALHATRLGWALHRIHHADAAMDVSTAVRFHPGEALVSMLYKSAATALLGLPWQAVLAFEAWLAIGSAIEHSNVRLPARAEARLRRFWVTPAMHRVHHSAHGDDHNHNYGFALSIWDQLFGTHRRAATGTQIGLPQSRAAG